MMATTNPKIFFYKWWLMLANGALLILLSYFLFSKPGKLVATSVTIAGFIALLTGTIAIVGYFLAGKHEKNNVEVYTGLLSCLAGLFFLSATPLAYELVTWFFAVYMVFNTSMLVSSSWHLKTEISWWWFSMILLLYSMLVLYFFISGNTFLNISIAVFAGLQFFINGILNIMYAFIVRKMQQEFSQTIHQIRSGHSTE